MKKVLFLNVGAMVLFYFMFQRANYFYQEYIDIFVDGLNNKPMDELSEGYQGMIGPVQIYYTSIIASSALAGITPLIISILLFLKQLKN